VSARVHGPVAEVLVRQRFENDLPAPIEAVYVFPLPDGASVHRMEFRIADRVVRAVVKEKGEARREYEQARSEGRAATLLEEDRPTLFMLSVANVAPGVIIDVELEYQELLTYDDGRFRLVFPMAAPERYREGPAPSTKEKLPPPRLPSGERLPDVAIDIELRDGRAIKDPRCLSHPVEVAAIEGSGGGLRVRLSKTAALANRDFVLEWQAAEEGVRPRARVERHAGEPGAFLVTIIPPASDADPGPGHGDMRAVKCGNCGGLVTDLGAIREIPGLGVVVPCRYCGALLAPGTERVTRAVRPRDVVILVDRSASMRGAALGAGDGGASHARAAVRAILGALRPDDAAQIIAFDHERVAFDGDGSRFLALSPELVAAADRFLAGLHPRGGTELEEALERAAALPVRDGRTRLVVLLGDAAVGNEGRLLRKLPAILGAQTRLFVLGMGRGVDRRLVSRLARAGGGASDVVPPWGDPSEILARFARRVAEAGPVLTDLALFWEGAGASDIYPKPIPDLYAGQPIHILGRFSGAGATRLVLTGRTGAGTAFRQELPVDLPEASDETPGLTRLWARRQVEALAERAADDPGRADALRGEALALSLKHSIVGPFTSLVAVDSAIAVEKKMLRKGRLVVVRGADQGRVFLLDRERMVIGRTQDSDIRLNDTLVSRHHLEILADETGFVFRDLASVNGTLVDKQLAREARLREGMEIELGKTLLRFDLDPTETFAFLPTRRVEAALPVESEPTDLPSAAAAAFEDDEEASSRDVMRSAAPRLMREEEASREAPPALQARRLSMAMPSAPPAAAAAPPPPLPGAMAMARPAMPPPPSAMPRPAAPPPPPAMGAPPPPPAMGAPPVPRAPSAPPGLGPPPRARSLQAPSASIPQSPIEAPGSEPYPELELRWLHDRIRGELDLVFLVDATGSMGPYINEVKLRLLELIDALRASPLCRSLRIGVVSYRDHPPQDNTYASHVTPLTADIEPIRSAVLALSASGGGDGPEAVTDGLYDVVRLSFRPASARAVVWFGDAPPHGVEPKDDAWPAGCPCGHHWYAQAESCREMGVAVYAIGCLPALRSYVGAEAVFRTVARATRGMFLPLREAGLLVPLIAGAAASELDKQRLDEHVAEVLRENAEALAATDEAERARWITAALRARGVRVRAMDLTRELAPAPLRFRDVELADVEGALDRLRLAGRVAA
jgi:Mg-chelatase subunit ChlD